MIAQFHHLNFEFDRIFVCAQVALKNFGENPVAQVNKKFAPDKWNLSHKLQQQK